MSALAEGEAGAVAKTFFTRGWARFGPDPETLEWAAAARPLADRLVADPDLTAQWLRCGGTWFAGVNALPNDAAGAVPAEGVPPLAGPALDFLARHGFADIAWDAGQISACFPGYPRPWDRESPANFRYRRDRDAAHVDGLLRDDARRRFLGETHGFLLGLPLTDPGPEAAPFVVWEGSHEIMRRAFRARLAGIPPEAWVGEDITDTYHAARREAFETCPRVEVQARPGEATLMHRLTLHGVAPWRAGKGARIIAYFRPDPFPGAAPDWWLSRP